jgi:hypothetical protein
VEALLHAEQEACTQVLQQAEQLHLAALTFAAGIKVG